MRLDGYDHHEPGYYFLTFCTNNRIQLFVDESRPDWTLTPSGEMVLSAIREMEALFPDAQVDSFAIMPNHIHLLIGISITISSKGQDSVIDAMHWLKTVTTGRYIKGVKERDWPRFDGELWQEGYHDRIVRNESELEAVRKYIDENPDRWQDDEFFD